jgi:NAD-dependent dihydropyrimidine dehydrogenase PreA subunit
MAVRKIIQIDEEKCNGCGKCVDACAEGALELKNGKAKVVRDLLCDGFGACLGECPQKALTIIEREAEPFDEEVAKKHVEHLKSQPQSCGCPSATPMLLKPQGAASSPVGGAGSELGNWPIQMRLVSPDAPYFKNARLLIAGDCTAFAFASMHPDFIKGRATIIGCPKLDDNDEFIDKLASILSQNKIGDITLVHMEVPCCGQMKRLVGEAKKRAGAPTAVKSYTVRRTGELVEDLA